jgi:hypothetical protein
MTCGWTIHSATFPVFFTSSSERTTYQPFCATVRPSSSINSPLSALIVTRRSGSSGANTIVFPIAIGSGSTYSPRPRSSNVE